MFKSHLFYVFTSCFYHGKSFLHCEKVAYVVTLKNLLGLSREFWAAVTELVWGIWLVPAHRPKGTLLHRVWEEYWLLPPWGSENLAISEETENSICLGGREESGSVFMDAV